MNLQNFRVLFACFKTFLSYERGKIKIAVQKSGRLSEDSTNLLKRGGLKFNNGLGKLKSEAENFPVEIYFLRDDDIPQYVADGVADVGIVGGNVLAEAGQTG